MVEYLVVGLGLVALLLPGVVLIGSQRIKRQVAQDHLHLLPTGNPRPPHVPCGGRRT